MTNSVTIGAPVTDPSLFTSGALFTQDYLLEGITGTEQCRAVDSKTARAALDKILSGFPILFLPFSAYSR